MRALGGYEAVLGAIDIIPKNNRHHKKFGAVKLVNAVNIVTSTQPYAEFLQGLIPETDPDPSQANRRFPLIIPIHMHDFDILINSGYLNKDTYSDYTAYKNIVGSFGEMARRLNSRPELLLRAETELVKPVIEAHGVVEGRLHRDEFEGMSDDEILDALKHEGLGKVNRYRDKTMDELRAEYEEFLTTVNPNHWLYGDKFQSFDWWLATQAERRVLDVDASDDAPTE